jgi:protein-export membrane protein SecD
MNKNRIVSLILIVVFAALGYGLYASQYKNDSWFARFPFVLGLDLNGGTELVYKADVSKIEDSRIDDSMDVLHEVIERRVNMFGVSEPIIQVESASALAGRSEHRLIVELPGVTDIDKAIALIGQTPLLEFKLVKQDLGKASVDANGVVTVNADSATTTFIATDLTGRYLERAAVEFNPTTGEPAVSVTFNAQGKELFSKITKENVNKPLAIFLDGELISAPIIREEISSGMAQISGNFTPQEAKKLVQNLNYGALPVPIELVGTQVVGPYLGEAALQAGVHAGIWGFLIVVLFLILWYRLPGLVASLALVIYIIISLIIFKLIPVTLTAAGIAGFILSIGMAVDANILIFERMKEELKRGRNLNDAMHEGFHRAWLSIRDSNISSIITAIVLFWIGTSAVKGFAFTLGIGVLVSMFTAITVSRNFLYALGLRHESKLSHFLFGAGFSNSQPTVGTTSTTNTVTK